VDETGHAGHAVPVNHDGTSQPAEVARRNGWAQVPAQPQAHLNGSTWSTVESALDPADPLSPSWPGSSGYGSASYPDSATPVAADTPVGTGYETPQAEPSGHEAVAAVPPERPAPRSWADWPPSAPSSRHRGFAEEHTPPNGVPVAPPAEPPAPPPSEHRYAEPPRGEQAHTEPPRGEQAHTEPPPSRPRRAEPPPSEPRPSVSPPSEHRYAVPPQVEHQGAEQLQGEPRRAQPPQVEARRAEPPEVGPRGAEPPSEHRYAEPPQFDQPRASQWRAEPWRAESRRSEVLPQRVPAQPDVPALPPGIAEEVGLRAEAPELARIATYLRHDAAPPTRHAFDVDAVLGAVREVDGVRGAELRRNPNGVHTLRLDLADGTDAGQVSRVVARLLGERMGLSAALGAPAPAPAQPAPPQPVQSAEPPAPAYEPIRRHSGSGVRGRAAVRPPTDEDHRFASSAAGADGTGGLGQATGSQRASRPLPAPAQGIRVVLDHVQVSTFGLDATVEVRLTLGERGALGEAHGPAVDGYLLRLCAVSAAKALDQLLLDPPTGRSRARCFVEHAALVPYGTGEVAVAVVLLMCDGWVEQLAGSAIATGDPRQAVVRATLAAVNRRLESLLP
jgi:hypothetical protein